MTPDPFPNTPRNEESDVDKRKRRRAVEIVVAWSCMAVMVAATVAAVWLAVGPVAGLFALAAYAAVTGYHAHAGTLIDWGER